MTLVAVHLTLWLESSVEVRLITLATVLGAVVEIFQIGPARTASPRGTMIDALPPPWLLAMWAQFATTLVKRAPIGVTGRPYSRHAQVSELLDGTRSRFRIGRWRRHR